MLRFRKDSLIRSTNRIVRLFYDMGGLLAPVAAHKTPLIRSHLILVARELAKEPDREDDGIPRTAGLLLGDAGVLFV